MEIYCFQNLNFIIESYLFKIICMKVMLDDQTSVHPAQPSYARVYSITSRPTNQTPHPHHIRSQQLTLH